MNYAKFIHPCVQTLMVLNRPREICTFKVDAQSCLGHAAISCLQNSAMFHHFANQNVSAHTHLQTTYLMRRVYCYCYPNLAKLWFQNTIRFLNNYLWLQWFNARVSSITLSTPKVGFILPLFTELANFHMAKQERTQQITYDPVPFNLQSLCFPKNFAHARLCYHCSWRLFELDTASITRVPRLVNLFCLKIHLNKKILLKKLIVDKSDLLDKTQFQLLC